MQNKIVVYTSVFGGYDGLLPQPKIKGIDRICFTDRPLKSRCWNIVQVQPQFVDSGRSSRLYKINPHLFLKEYDISIYIDANFLVVGNLLHLVNSVLSLKPMAVFDHNKTSYDRRDCIYDEYRAIIKMGETHAIKDDPIVMQKQIDRYRNEGFPPHNGLISGGVLIRKHNDPHVIRTMDRWWNEFSNGSKRDQLSFNYAAWRENFNYNIIEGDIRNNEWFFMIGLHRKNYFWKLFRFRLRKLLGIKKR
jgi:hypothetical protein